MTTRWTIGLAVALLTLTAAACTSDDADLSSATSTTVSPSPSTEPTGTLPTTGGTASTTPPSATAAPDPSTPRAEETIIRFTSNDVSVDVTIGADNATIRDFLSMLPLTLRFEDLSSREKISYLPRPLDTSGAPGSDPDDGDLIYYTPWGNVGFYYDAAGIGYSDQTIHLGTYDATLDQLTLLEAGDVTVAVIE